MAINISSLSLTLKYVKYCCLGQNPKNTSQTDLRFSNMSQLFRSKTTIPIINQEHNIKYLNITLIHKRSNRLLSIPMGRISHT